jgi:uncharacterized surface protein with fasciclin (FAS1) repeats
MRYISSTLTFLFLFLFCTVSTAWDLPSLSSRKRIPQPLVDTLQARNERRVDPARLHEWIGKQEPLQGAAMASKQSKAQGGSGDPIISDVLPKTRGINIFASLTRQFESVEGRLNDPSQNVTVLAPRNSAIQDLPRKPWENPQDYEQFGEAKAYEGDEGQDRAKRNLERFVTAHIVVQSPWKEGDEAETLGGDKLTWRKDGDHIYVSTPLLFFYLLWCLRRL